MNLTNGDLPKTVAAEPTPCGRNLSGTTVGRFFIRARVGAGGMGEVYRADDPQLRRTVAIKRLSHSSDRELLKEAQRASALNDPHIAAVYDVFAEGDELFLVMEYVDGMTLSSDFNRRSELTSSTESRCSVWKRSKRRTRRGSCTET
jgi:serine/threonine protein kinase